MALLVLLSFVVAVYGVYCYHPIERDGEVRAGYVCVGERYYEGVNIDFSKEGKKIGKMIPDEYRDALQESGMFK